MNSWFKYRVKKTIFRIVKMIFLSCLFLVLISPLSAEKVNLDSLKKVWNNESQPDTTRLNAIEEIVRNGYLNGQPDSAFYFAQLAHDFAKSKGLKKQMAGFLYLQGMSFHYRSDYIKAIDYYTRGLTIFEEIGDKKGIAKCLQTLGIIYWRKGDYAKAIEYLTHSLTIYEEIGHKTGVANSFNNIGLIYKGQGDYVKAIDYFNRGLTIFEETGDVQGTASCLINTGGIYYLQGDNAKAIDYYTRSLTIFKEIGDKRGMARSLNNIGNVYMDQGNYAKAIDYYTRSLPLKEAYGGKNDVALTLNNIGVIYKDQGDYVEAIDYYNRGLTIFEETGDKKGMANSLNNIGNVYKDQGNYAEAIDCHTRSLTVYEEIGAKGGIAESLFYIGDIYKYQADYVKSIEYYTRSLTIEKALENKRGIGRSLDHIGEVYLKQGDYNRAIAYGVRSLAMAQEVGTVLGTSNAANNLYKAYKATGRNKKALEMYELYMATRDSLNSEENQKGVIRQEYKYQYDKQSLADSLAFAQQQELDQLTHKAELDKEENQRYALIAGLCFLLMLGGVGYRGYQRKQQINELLEKQNDEKTAMMKEIHHRVKNNLQVVNSLLRLQSHEVKDEKVVAMFEECQDRVLSMALLHEKMYRSDDLKHIDIQGHFTLLVQDLLANYAVGKEIDLDIKIDEVDIGIRTLVPLGLIINEIITNSLKYAFKEDGKGTIKVHLKHIEGIKHELIIGDDGVGMDKDFKVKESSSLGRELIQIFTEQLEGTMIRLDVPGTQFRIEFEKIDKE